MTDIDRVVEFLGRLDAAATAGPWSLWRGPQFVGGGEDICIGAGETWLANMDHRANYNPRDHGEYGGWPGWQQIAETDIATIDSGEITREQEANAAALAVSRNALPLLIPLLRAALDGARAMHDAHVQVEDVHDDISRCVCLLSGPYRQLRVALAAFSTLIPEDE